jgi:hypothetical protein
MSIERPRDMRVMVAGDAQTNVRFIVGLADRSGEDLQTGTTAEANLRVTHGRGIVVNVSTGAIPAHDADHALARAACYVEAARIAQQMRDGLLRGWSVPDVRLDVEQRIRRALGTKGLIR